MSEDDAEGTDSGQDIVSLRRRDPEEAFSLLGNETRIAILHALAESEGPATFSELRERVGTKDSGQFNYHLKKLRDHFVRRTDAGYELTLAGKQVVGALLSGTYTVDVSLDPIDVPHPCPRCGGDLVAAYEDESVRVACRDCEEWRNEFTVPPGTVEQFERDELLSAFDRWLRSKVDRIVRGFCTTCAGRLDPRLVREDGHPDSVHVEYVCARCGERPVISARFLLLTHPAVVSFYHEHGIDAMNAATWEIAGLADASLSIESEDPLTVRVELLLDEERLVATIDSDASIRSVEREPG